MVADSMSREFTDHDRIIRFLKIQDGPLYYLAVLIKCLGFSKVRERPGQSFMGHTSLKHISWQGFAHPGHQFTLANMK